MEVTIPNELIAKAVKSHLDSIIPDILDQRLKQELQTKKVYNIKEACQLLNMSFNTLKKFLLEGKITHTMIGPKPGFTEANLIEFVRSGVWSRINIHKFNSNKDNI